MKKKLIYLLAAAAIVLGFARCNKSVKDLLGDTRTDTTTNGVTKHVLYIILDGARGSVVRTLNPTNIRNITYASTCTYYSLNNGSSYPEVSLADMLTGVDSTKHNVRSNDVADNHFESYPTITTRVKAFNAQMISYAYVRNANIAQYAFEDATKHQVMTSDIDVKNATVTSLQNDNPDFVVAEFHSIDSIGSIYGYQSSTVQYTQQITTVDGYIGDCLAAIQGRKSFMQEDWLVVVASNKGGALADDPNYGAQYYDNPVSNGFVLFYNPKFALTAYARPTAVAYTGSTPIYTSTSYYAQLSSASAFDIGATTETTIQFKMKIIALANNTYNPGILKKTNSSANSNQGWWFVHNNNTGAVRFVLKGASGSNQTLVSNVALVGEWHTYTGKVYNASDGKRYMKLYMDGISKGDSLAVTGLDCTTTTAMDLGQRGSYVSGTTSEMVTDVQIFDSALPDATIAQYACTPGITDEHPYYSHLIGYWSCNSTGKNYIEDLTGNGNNFNFTGAASTNWNAYSDISNYVCVPVTDDYLTQNPRGVDIPYQIYAWFGIAVPSNWGLDGKAWPYNYAATSN